MQRGRGGEIDLSCIARGVVTRETPGSHVESWTYDCAEGSRALATSFRMADETAAMPGESGVVTKINFAGSPRELLRETIAATSEL